MPRDDSVSRGTEATTTERETWKRHVQFVVEKFHDDRERPCHLGEQPPSRTTGHSVNAAPALPFVMARQRPSDRADLFQEVRGSELRIARGKVVLSDIGMQYPSAPGTCEKTLWLQLEDDQNIPGARQIFAIIEVLKNCEVLPPARRVPLAESSGSVTQAAMSWKENRSAEFGRTGEAYVYSTNKQVWHATPYTQHILAGENYTVFQSYHSLPVGATVPTLRAGTYALDSKRVAWGISEWWRTKASRGSSITHAGPISRKWESEGKQRKYAARNFSS
ncbi:hypothetical protein DOTSEDRAFT_34247 [Dothistroma septosporum NZE10]|uniref:Uncharacterized protein n=1 Tax=Dothistroma septosporum (strain NZE10 / CBS 128990) TaxID=675120 RepID=N1PTS8_DOTSN|nr:hypothetical protein DOTSEDRAFT_34247 [Dothistroma septosporum NZE10]